MRPFLIIAVIATMSAAQASAQEFNPDDAETFFQRCNMQALQNAPGEVWGICNGFVDGIVARERVALREKAFCVDERHSRLDAYVTLESYLRQHPEDRKLSTAFVALKAFRAAFPCESKVTSK